MLTKLQTSKLQRLLWEIYGLFPNDSGPGRMWIGLWINDYNTPWPTGISSTKSLKIFNSNELNNGRWIHSLNRMIMVTSKINKRLEYFIAWHHAYFKDFKVAFSETVQATGVAINWCMFNVSCLHSQLMKLLHKMK